MKPSTPTILLAARNPIQFR